MNHFIKNVFVLVMAIPAGCHAVKSYEAVNKTTFRSHGLFTYTSPERTTQFSSSWTKKDRDTYHAALQVVPFYSQTTNDCKVASFFTPFGKSRLVAGEYNSESVNDRTVDVIANYFGVQTAPITPRRIRDLSALTFQSTLNLKARQKVFGIGVDCIKRLNNDWWLEVAFPIVRVENQLCMQEDIANYGNNNAQEPHAPADAVGSMSEALKSSYFRYGKIDGKRHHKWGVADVELSVGYDWLNSEACAAHTAFGVIVPTGTKPHPQRVFSPYIGDAKHAGIFLSSHIALVAHECDDYMLGVRAKAVSKYSFKNTQCRSFDLVGKPWGRYLWVYPNLNDARQLAQIVQASQGLASGIPLFEQGLIQPAINFLTQPVVVRPGSSFDYQCALVLDRCNLRLEAGMNGHFRQAERLCLARPWQEGPGIVDIETIIDAIPNTRSYSQINALNHGITTDTDASNNATYVTIKERDLDLSSAAQPAIFTRTLFASLGYTSDEYSDVEYLFNMGGSYEFAESNAAFDRWTIWVKGGLNF